MAKVQHRSGSYPIGQMATDQNTRTSLWPSVMPTVRGMQPPPQDKRKLAKECTRIAWAIHCLQNVRAKSVLILERQTAKLHQLRREHDAYACALQDMDPELFALVEQRRRDFDDPIRALEWAAKGSIDDLA